MTSAAPLQHTAAKAPGAPARRGLLLQRRCACAQCGAAGLRAGLAIEAGDSPLEREAERVADQVVAAAHPAAGGARPSIQRSAQQARTAPGSAPASVEEVLATPGRPLDAELRQDLAARFGHDFSKVRVHADPAAAQSAREVGADAYTVGHDIVFGAGKYAAGTAAGRRLVAHELTHVVQQGASPTGKRTLSRYRSKGKDTIAFEGADETLTDPATQPWIDNISISFDKAVADTGHAADAKAAGQLAPRMPSGTLTAKYSTASSKVNSDIVLPITGGSTMLGIGLTDRVKNSKVTRLEGLGYTDSENVKLGNLKDPVAKKGKGARYSASGAGTMNYAIFFKGIQAIHEGGLGIGSHACVHVGTQSSIRTLNHHSRIGKTTVTVSYASSVLDDLCCHRKNTGNTSWDTNPCEKTTCP